MERCRNGDNTRFKIMFNDERRKLRISRQAACAIPLVKLRSSMRRARLENRPRIPHSLKDLDKVLRRKKWKALSRTLDGKDNVYAGRAGSAAEKTLSLVFFTRRMCKYLRKVKKIYCDATFSPVPRGMKAHQVWTISTVLMHHAFPLVRVLMRRRTTKTYQAALDHISHLAPGFQPEEVMCDYEPAEMKALHRKFPNARLSGCLFHYAKAVGSHLKKLKMVRLIRKNARVRTLCRMMCVLPLLPHDRIKEGFLVICDQIVKKRVSHKMHRAVTYWIRTWLPKVHVLSVCGCTDRTTNACESDNRMFQDSVRHPRPNVWDFMDGILDMEDCTQQDLYVIRRRKASRARAVTAEANDETVRALTALLKEDAISVRSFLKEASYTIVKSMNRGLNGRKKKKNV
ncbi:hypothetical protein ONE63_011490 [Megalurothrips usitatus]|uniref:MULE transposase domain-containing protein n=1 Tax=Megalurothrips usitatus TaxID=439358 RepID=A0AAV7WZ66_9NEOP|nr:hypothetical protein ONE63_011490 [Megalurothrips usitatus]